MSLCADACNHHHHEAVEPEVEAEEGEEGEKGEKCATAIALRLKTLISDAHIASLASRHSTLVDGLKSFVVELNEDEKEIPSFAKGVIKGMNAHIAKSKTNVEAAKALAKGKKSEASAALKAALERQRKKAAETSEERAERAERSAKNAAAKERREKKAAEKAAALAKAQQEAIALAVREAVKRGREEREREEAAKRARRVVEKSLPVAHNLVEVATHKVGFDEAAQEATTKASTTKAAAAAAKVKADALRREVDEAAEAAEASAAAKEAKEAAAKKAKAEKVAARKAQRDAEKVAEVKSQRLALYAAPAEVAEEMERDAA